MPEAAAGTKVGSAYFDLVFRDTIQKQVQDLSAKAQAAAQQRFLNVGKAAGTAMCKGMEGAANAVSGIVQKSAASAQKAMDGTFSKSIANLQAKLHLLENTHARLASSMDAMWQNGGSTSDAAFAKLIDQQQRVTDKIKYLQERLTIEREALAQRQAAAEQAAYAKIARAAESSARRQQAAARQAHTTAAPPADASRRINTANAVRLGDVSGMQREAQQTESIWKAAFSRIANTAKTALGRAFSTIGRTAQSALGKLGSSLGSLSKRLLSMNGLLGRAGRGIQRIGVRLGSIISGALIFNVISAGLTRMVSALGSALTSSDELNQALANLKGAAATAAAPLLQVLTPALTALANAAATVFSYISQLVSFFTGKSVSAMAATAKGMASVGSAASGTAKQVKNASRSLASFDEITRLDSPQDASSGGGGGGASASVPNYDFQGKSPFLDSMLSAIKSGDWYQVGALVAQKLNEGMAALDWTAIDKTAVRWAENLYNTLNGAVHTLDWGLLGDTIGNGLNTVLHFIDTFFQGIDWTALGTGLATSLNRLFSTLDWTSLGRVLTDKFKALFEMLHGFVQTFDFAALGQSLAAGTMAAINNVNWVQAAGDAGAFAVGILQLLTTWVQGIDWAALGTTIADCLLSIDWGALLLNLLLFIGETLSGLAEMAASFFAELAQACGDGFLGGILQCFADIYSWVKDVMIDPLVNAVKDLLGIHSPSTVFSDIGQNLVLGLFDGISGIWSKITNFFSTALDSIKKKFSDTWKAVKENVSGTFESIRSTMVSIWNGIAETIRDAVNTVLGFMNRLLSGAASMVNGLVDILNRFKIEVPEGVPMIGGTTFGFSLSHVSAPQIPMLANGGVIRQPTLAMMGEYAGAGSNPEIAAPQSAISEAMASANEDVVDAILTAGQQIIDAIRNQQGDVIVAIDDDSIGNAVQRWSQRNASRSGKPYFVTW